MTNIIPQNIRQAVQSLLQNINDNDIKTLIKFFFNDDDINSYNLVKESDFFYLIKKYNYGLVVIHFNCATYYMNPNVSINDINQTNRICYNEFLQIYSLFE